MYVNLLGSLMGNLCAVSWCSVNYSTELVIGDDPDLPSHAPGRLEQPFRSISLMLPRIIDAPDHSGSPLDAAAEAELTVGEAASSSSSSRPSFPSSSSSNL
jgi:hypothetical protein